MLVRRIARPMLASMFISGGLDAARHPAGKAAKAEKINAGTLADTVGLGSTEQLVRANGIAQVVGGLALASGRVPRLAATALIASLAPTTMAGHRFWEEQDAVTRQQQQVHFLKNLSMLGGLLLAAVDTGGRESLGRKVRRRSGQLADGLPSLGS